MHVIRGWLVAVVCLAGHAWAAPTGVRPGDNMPAKMAEARLNGGFPVMAMQVAQSCMDEDADNHACREVFARAAALAGRCDEALDALRVLRTTEQWSYALAVAEGTCHVRGGDTSAAIVAFDEAAWFKPGNDGPPLQRGLVHARLGDVEALDRDLAQAWSNDAELWVIETLQIWRAWIHDDPELDALLHAFHRWREGGADRNLLLHASLVDCYAWMRVGENLRAQEVADLGVRVSRGHNRVLSCRSEAERRGGDAERAAFLLTRPWQTAKKAPILDAVLARALVDAGRLDEAEALLQELPDMLDPDVVASWWYLARAQGRDEDAARLAARFAEIAVPSSLSIDDFVPLPETP